MSKFDREPVHFYVAAIGTDYLLKFGISKNPLTRFYFETNHKIQILLQSQQISRTSALLIEKFYLNKYKQFAAVPNGRNFGPKN